jgi:hypothetical protein
MACFGVKAKDSGNTYNGGNKIRRYAGLFLLPSAVEEFMRLTGLPAHEFMY